MTYNYNPPPPPPPAPPSSSPAGYLSYGPPRGGHSGRGRGGSDRGGFHQPPASYNYGQQPPQYGPQNPAPYSGPHPPQSGYPQPPQQQWHPDHGQQHPPPPNQHAPLPAQNYHPNYAPQVYQQAAPYNGQPQYPHAPPQPYGQGYPAPVPQPGPPAQQWGNHPPPPSNTGPYGGGGGGGGRGGRGGYNGRGGPKGQMMGPPIRIGFDGPPHNPPAPVSASYPPQPYGAPQGPPAPYSAPYPVYPPPAPYMPAPAPAPYEGRSGHNPRHHNRGGFHNNSMSRSHLGGDKNRHRNQHKGPIAQTPPTQHQKPDAASAGKKKKRKTNTLGLTPGDESEEDIENEEERLNEMYGAEAPNPKTSADIAAWIAERRANFPTKAKIEAKKAAGKGQNGDSAKDRALEQRAEKLRKQLKKVESSIKRKREQQDEGDDMRELHLSSSPSSDTKSDDEKPEVMSTRQDTSNPGLPPPPKRADPTKHCKYYSTGGTCGKRGKCRFVHDASVREAALKERELNGGRMTLQQRLTLNDKEQEDLTIVQTLKYLQDKGCLGKSTQTTAASNAQDESNPALKTEPKTELPTLPKKQPNNSLPPIPPPSIVSSGSGGKYAGWNMNGFGNHNRSNDH